MNYLLWKMKRTFVVAFICPLILIAPAQAATWHVSQHVTSGTGVGDSWPNAMASLTDAFSLAVSGDTILVGQGIYHPEINQSFTIDFNLDQLKLIGGYAGWLPNGTLAPDPDQRDVQANQTILSGDLEEDDAPFIFDRDYLTDASRTDNALTVVTVQGVTDGTRLEGFIIQSGNRGTLAGTPGSGVRGGGMYIDDSEMDVVNCTFRFNAVGIPPDPEIQFDLGTTSDGGGATVRGGQTVMGEVRYTRFINCTFHDNFSARGGALAVVDGSPTDTPTQVKVVNSLFYDNQALVISDAELQAPDGSGGALAVFGMGDALDPDTNNVMAEITNCTVSNNNADNATDDFGRIKQIKLSIQRSRESHENGGTGILPVQ